MNSERRKEPLHVPILRFRKVRNWIVIPLFAIGILSLALPVLPGLAFILAGIMIWKPDLADRLMRRFSAFAGKRPENAAAAERMQENP